MTVTLVDISLHTFSLSLFWKFFDVTLYQMFAKQKQLLYCVLKVCAKKNTKDLGANVICFRFIVYANSTLQVFKFYVRQMLQFISVMVFCKNTLRNYS